MLTPAIWFRDEAQRRAVAESLVALADEANQSECRVLCKLAFQLSAPYKDVGAHQLLTQLSPLKLRRVGELFVAMADGHESIDEWLALADHVT